MGEFSVEGVIDRPYLMFRQKVRRRIRNVGMLHLAYFISLLYTNTHFASVARATHGVTRL